MKNSIAIEAEDYVYIREVEVEWLQYQIKRELILERKKVIKIADENSAMPQEEDTKVFFCF